MALEREQRWFLGLSLGAMVFLGVLLVGTASEAATRFRIRGDVREVDAKNKVITLSVTHIEKGWPAVRFEKNPYTVRVSRKGTGVWKDSSDGKRVRLKIESIVIGGQVSVVGETRDDGTLDAWNVIIR